MRQIAIFTFLFLLSISAPALDWSADAQSFTSTAQTLGRGQSTFGFQTDQRNVTHRLSSNGQREPIGKGFRERKKISGGLATREYEMQMQQQRFVPSWQYGMTSQWSIGARLPITKTKTQVKSRAQMKTVQGEVKLFTSKQANEEFGDVERVETNNETQIGNFEFLSKEKFWQQKDNTLSLVQTFRFPSAQAVPADVYVNPFPDPSGYAVGIGAALETKLSALWALVFSAKHEVNFNDEVELRNFSQENERVSRNPGDESVAAITADFKPATAVVISAAYLQKYKSKDEYNKPVDEAFSNESAVEQSLAELSVGYSFDIASSVVDNWQTQLKYLSTIDGKNIEDSDSVSLLFQVVY